MEEVVSFRSEAFKTLQNRLKSVFGAIDGLLVQAKPSVQNERYYTGEEICRIFHISKRALQDYRDNRVIPYTSIGGKLLYPESELQKLLEKNFIPVK